MTMGITNTRTDTYAQIHCTGCGIRFYVPVDWRDEKMADGSGFRCPNGCERAWKDTEADKLRRRLAEQEKCTVRANARCDQAAADRDVHKRKAAAARGQVTKLKNRVGNGVCPCCNRTFANLAKHMENKHPDFAGDGADE